MEKDEILTLTVANIFFGLIAYTIGGIPATILSCIIVSYIVLFIIRYFKYSQKIGVFQVSPFACFIYDSSGLLASFKGTDWWCLEEPTTLLEVREKVARYDEHSHKFTNEILVEADYLEIYKTLQEELLKSLIPEPEEGNPTTTTTVTKTLTLDDIMRNIGDTELYNFYKSVLTLEQKRTLAKLMRKLLSVKLFDPQPKLYKIASLSNDVVIVWFAQSQPAEYYSYRSKMFFRKWKISPTVKGLPVVEMFGAEMNVKFNVAGRTLKALACLPIQDERYRTEKALNIKRYGIITSAISTYIEKLLDTLPALARLKLIEAERERYRQEAEIYRRGIMTIYSDVAMLSTLAFRSFSIASKVSGLASTLQVPKEIMEEIQALGITTKETESLLSKMRQKLESLVKEEEEKKTEEKTTVEEKKQPPTTEVE